MDVFCQLLYDQSGPFHPFSHCLYEVEVPTPGTCVVGQVVAVSPMVTTVKLPEYGSITGQFDTVFQEARGTFKIFKVITSVTIGVIAPMMKRVKACFYPRLKLLILVGVITPTRMGT